MSIFSRLFKVVQSEAHAAVDSFEDPIKVTEQGIRDLKKSLQAALASLAQVKSVAVRLRRDAESQGRLAQDYERKAMLLLQRGQGGQLVPAEADRLATAALEKKADAARRQESIGRDQAIQQKAADELQAKVETLRRDITRYENELITLRARARTADSMQKINKQLAGIDTAGTVAMLERMKERVLEKEALAQAYGELGAETTSVDGEIDAALATGDEPDPEVSDSLAALKRKMGLEA